MAGLWSNGISISLPFEYRFLRAQWLSTGILLPEHIENTNETVAIARIRNKFFIITLFKGTSL